LATLLVGCYEHLPLLANHPLVSPVMHLMNQAFFVVVNSSPDTMERKVQEGTYHIVNNSLLVDFVFALHSPLPLHATTLSIVVPEPDAMLNYSYKALSQ
jgi:ABC-type uncharacterized transport system substrate-binding protein